MLAPPIAPTTAESPAEPKVLAEHEDVDGLAPAKGIMIGVLLGLLLWLIVVFAVSVFL